LYLTINEDISSAKGGVSNKLLNKVRAIGTQVSGCTLLNARISLDHDEVKELSSNSELNDIQIGVQNANKGSLNTINTDKTFYKKLTDYIVAKNYKQDRIIMRYPLASPGLLHLAKNFSGKIVFEHNTKEGEEVKLSISRKNYAPFSLRPSKFFFWLNEKKIPLHFENHLAPKILGYAHSGACVTSEIAAYEKKRALGYRTFVSSNFYNISETTLIKRSYDPAKEPLCIGMIVTTTAAWYGLERLLRSFSKVQKNFRLVLAGIEPDNAELKSLLSKYNITENFFVPGKLPKARLHEFYSQVHICLGSLALFKIGLNYASTLKVKESVSCGIPVAPGYFEEDFHSNEEFKPFYFQIPNDDSDINFSGLQKFAQQFYSGGSNQQKLRDLAMKYLDVNVKVKQLVKNISE
jgi:hypothetical protein